MPVFYSDGTSIAWAGEGSPNLQPGDSISSINGEIRYIQANPGGETSLRKSISGNNVRYFSFDYRMDPTAVHNNNHTILHFWGDNYSSDLVQILLQPPTNGGDYQAIVFDPSLGTAGTSTGAFLKGTTYKIELIVDDVSATLKFAGTTVSTLTGRSWIGKYLGVFALGSFYSSGFSGTQYVDNIYADPSSSTLPPPPTTDIGRLQDVYAGWKQRHVRSDGVVLSHVAENRSVSEGQAYALKYAVQFNDRSFFDLVENYTYNHYDRRNYPDGGGGINPPSDALNLMAYDYSITTNKVRDWAAAYDADIDRAVALLWAHARWGSSSTINYLSRAQAIIADLDTYGLRQASFDNKWYMVSGTGNMSISNPEMNNGYLDPAAFRLFAQYTSNPAKDRWSSAVSSSQDIIKRTADAVLPNPVAPGNTQTTTAKLPANWVTMNFSTGAVTPLSASYRDTNYTYDAFRQTNRLLYDYINYGDNISLDRIRDYKNFLSTEWTNKGYIRAEYFHDGSEKEAYSNRMFYYAAYQVLTASDATNTVGQAIYDSFLKSSDMYVQDANGSYYDASTNNSGDSGYYGLSWLMFDEMQRLGMYQNFGQQSLTPDISATTFRVSSNDAFLIM